MAQNENKPKPQELIPMNSARDRSLSDFERKSLRYNWITLIFVVLTFVVFFLQVRESKIQTGILREQVRQAEAAFRVDQRPYIWMANTQDNIILKLFANTLVRTPNIPADKSQLFVELQYTNFGKSPAIELQDSYDIEYGEDAIQKLKTVPLRPAKTIVPTGSVNKLGIVGVSDDTTTLSSAAKNIDSGVAIFVRWQYLDTERHRYECDFCMAHLVTGAWAYCPIHNELKDCEKDACEN